MTWTRRAFTPTFVDSKYGPVDFATPATPEMVEQFELAYECGWKAARQRLPKLARRLLPERPPQAG